MISEKLTTELLRKKFKNNFDLCNFSINIARNIILGGKPSSLSEILEIIDERAGDEQGRERVSE